MEGVGDPMGIIQAEDLAIYVGDRRISLEGPIQLVPDDTESQDCCPSIEPVEFTCTLDPEQSEQLYWNLRFAMAVQRAINPHPPLTRPNTRSSAGVGTFRGWFTERTDDALIASGDLSDIVPYPCEATCGVEVLGDPE